MSSVYCPIHWSCQLVIFIYHSFIIFVLRKVYKITLKMPINDDVSGHWPHFRPLDGIWRQGIQDTIRVFLKCAQIINKLVKVKVCMFLNSCSDQIQVHRSFPCSLILLYNVTCTWQLVVSMANGRPPADRCPSAPGAPQHLQVTLNFYLPNGGMFD